MIDEKWTEAQKAEKIFWKNWNRTEKWRINYWKKWMEFFSQEIKFPNFSKVLEIGCGPKGFINYLSNEYKVGIEPLIQNFYDRIKKSKKEVNFISSIGESLPFINESFDLVLCINVLDHTNNPAMLISEANRVLRTGGIAIFDISSKTIVQKILEKILKQVDVYHPNRLYANDYIKMIEKSNFKIVMNKFDSELQSKNIGFLRKFILQFLSKLNPKFFSKNVKLLLKKID